MYQENRLFIPNNPQTLRICPELASEIGLSESIVFLQLEFLIAISGHEKEGRKWTYQTIKDMREKFFPFWTEDGLKRIINRLVKKGLIAVGRFNKARYDRTNWYALRYENVKNLANISIVEKVPNGLETKSTMDSRRSTQPIPESSQRIHKESERPIFLEGKRAEEEIVDGYKELDRRPQNSDFTHFSKVAPYRHPGVYLQ